MRRGIVRNSSLKAAMFQISKLRKDKKSLHPEVCKEFDPVTVGGVYSGLSSQGDTVFSSFVNITVHSHDSSRELRQDLASLRTTSVPVRRPGRAKAPIKGTLPHDDIEYFPRQPYPLNCADLIVRPRRSAGCLTADALMALPGSRISGIRDKNGK